MSDITTTWTGAHGDYELAGAELAAGDDLATSMLISLFTDRRAGFDDVISNGSDDPRGWWGDPDMGSRLWLLERAKRTQATLQAARSYIEEALQWLINTNVVSKFDIIVDWPPGSTLQAQVVAIRGDGSRKAMQFTWVWN